MPLIDRAAVRTIAVVGAGIIGASWTAYFLARGFAVRATDTRADGDAFVRDYIEKAWPTLMRFGLVRGADKDRWTFHRTPAEAAAGADFVQENVFERLDLKQQVLAEIDAAMSPDRVIASSTSGFMPSELQARCRHPQRVVVGHPFNPPHLVPLVEVVGGKHTDPAAVDWTVGFYNAVGKKAIRLNKEVTGHIANRLQLALWREALHCIDQGIASVADVDAAIAYGPGLRWAFMGPSLTFHLAGGAGGMTYFLQHYKDGIESDWKDLGQPDLTDSLQRKLIDGMAPAVGAQDFADLAAWRDRCLEQVLLALKDKRS
ncbi:MAG: 3-hydroxyacyl-CoA dehydrogenase NAD-binding domain-containing protein [Dongiaceae bacterium]